ncbi:fatty acid desaturase family protein [Endothiovibrio diazotrophicus]
MKIDKKYYEVSLLHFYTDFLFTLSGVIIAFILCLNTSGLPFFLSYVVATALLYRAAVFAHELTHQSRNPRMKTFSIVWNLTLGALTLIPAVRFYQPHLTHHQVGVFGTTGDPQYMMIRSDKKLAAFVLLAVPFIMPIWGLLLVLLSSVGVIDVEGAVERYLARKGYTVGAALPPEHKRSVTRYGRYYLVLITLFVWQMPEAIPLVYAIHVGAWWMATLRIPLEHGMREYRETSDARDQVIDSFTVESPLAGLLQPLSLRLHTAHHMYPGVPYHNLPALHAELKRTDEEYRKSIVSFWTAVRGPQPPAAPSPETVTR